MDTDQRQHFWLQVVFNQSTQGVNSETAIEYANALIAGYDVAFPSAPEAPKLTIVQTDKTGV